MKSGELYREYRTHISKPVVDRTYRKYMKKMTDLDLIKADGKRRGRTYEVVM